MTVQIFTTFDDDTMRRAMREALRVGFAGNDKALQEAKRQGYIRFRSQFGVCTLTTRGRNFMSQFVEKLNNPPCQSGG